jgi:hypothetical protein
MSEKRWIELYVAINEDGDFECAADASDAVTALSENAGGVCLRTIKITLSVTLPAVIELPVIDVPDEIVEADAKVA